MRYHLLQSLYFAQLIWWRAFRTENAYCRSGHVIAAQADDKFVKKVRMPQDVIIEPATPIIFVINELRTRYRSADGQQVLKTQAWVSFDAGIVLRDNFKCGGIYPFRAKDSYGVLVRKATRKRYGRTTHEIADAQHYLGPVGIIERSIVNTTHKASKVRVLEHRPSPFPLGAIRAPWRIADLFERPSLQPL